MEANLQHLVFHLFRHISHQPPYYFSLLVSRQGAGWCFWSPCWGGLGMWLKSEHCPFWRWSPVICAKFSWRKEYGGAIFIDDESDTFQCGKGFNKGRWKMCNPRGKQPLLLYVLCHEYGSSLLINSFSNYSSEMPLANYQLFKRQACAVVKLQ